MDKLSAVICATPLQAEKNAGACWLASVWILQRWFDETRDPVAMRSVKFRVEVREIMAQQARVDFQVGLGFIQERGSVEFESGDDGTRHDGCVV
jgi:hypothetical protein